MDANIATVLVALIGVIGTTITAIINKKQKVVMQKVEKQNLFVAKEKGLRQKLNQKEKEREETIHDVMLLILDTNISILKNTASKDLVDSEVFKKSEELKQRFNDISESIDDIYREYEIVLEMTNSFQEEIKNNK